MNASTGEGYQDEDRLPWLETVEDDYRERRPAGRIVLLIVLAVLALAAVGFGFWWLQQHQSQGGNGELIQAQEGDYKVKPDEPGGMKVDGEGDSVFATSQGAASNASINMGALPEAPVQGRAAEQVTDGAKGDRSARLNVPGASSALPSSPPRVIPNAGPTGAGSGSLIQLGAFPNERGANVAWTSLSKRFSYLAPLGKSVERAETNGKTFWRLRVNAGSNGQARELCNRLKVAGESCFVTN
jgi:hypothetical protein